MLRSEPLRPIDYETLASYGIAKDTKVEGALVTYEAGENIARQGECLRGIDIVISGKAKITRSTPDGKHLLLSHCLSSGMVGDLELMTDHFVASSTVQALTKVRSIALPYAHNAETLKQNAPFLLHIGSELAKKLLQTSQLSTFTALYTLENRLCMHLITHEKNGVFREKLTETAEQIGCSYRHLHRCLHKLCQDEVIIKGKRGFVLQNQAELHRLAGEMVNEW